MEEKIKAHIFVSGLVQGVFFRANTVQKARELELKGWVKNLPDGRVEAIFEGEKKNVREMIEWAKRGPANARIDDFEADFEKYTGEFDNFEVKHY